MAEMDLRSILDAIREKMQNDLVYYERAYGEMDGEPLAIIERAIASLEKTPTPEQETKVRSFDWNKYLTDFYTPIYADTETPQEAEKVVREAMKQIGGNRPKVSFPEEPIKLDKEYFVQDALDRLAQQGIDPNNLNVNEDFVVTDGEGKPLDKRELQLLDRLSKEGILDVPELASIGAENFSIDTDTGVVTYSNSNDYDPFGNPIEPEEFKTTDGTPAEEKVTTKNTKISETAAPRGSVDAVIAISSVDQYGKVKGGTGYATELALLEKIPVYVFDQDTMSWLTASSTQTSKSGWTKVDFPPSDFKSIAGIGASGDREPFTEEGRKAVIDYVSRLSPETVIHSGGAKGADSAFEDAHLARGGKVVAHSFSGHDTKSKNQLIHTPDELSVASDVMQRAIKSLGRNASTSPYVRNLITRNTFQVIPDLASATAGEITSTAEAMNAGLRTSTTRAIAGAKVGDYLDFSQDGVRGVWRIKEIVKYNFDNPEDVAKWESTEGWNFARIREQGGALLNQVLKPNSRTFILERQDSAPSGAKVIEQPMYYKYGPDKDTFDPSFRKLPSATTSDQSPKVTTRETRNAWEIPNNIYSRVSPTTDMPDFRAALTNRTNDIEKTSKGGVQDAFSKDQRGRQVIKTKYPVVLDGMIFPSAEHAYYHIDKTKGAVTEDDMSRIIAEKLRQHPRLLAKLTELGGRSWIEAQSHFTGSGERRTPDAWQGEGLKSGFIRALAAAYDAAAADPVGETLARPEGKAMVEWAQDPANWSKFPVVQTSGKARKSQTYDVPEFIPSADQPLQAKWRQMEQMSYPEVPSERMGPILRGTGAFGMRYSEKDRPFVTRESTPDLAGYTIQDVIANIATRNGVDLTMGGRRQAGLPTVERLSPEERNLDPQYLGRLFDTLLAAAEHIMKTPGEPSASRLVEQMGVSGKVETEPYIPSRTIQAGAPDMETGKIPTIKIKAEGGQLKATQSQRPFADVPPVARRPVTLSGTQDQVTLQEISLVLRKIASLLNRYADPRSSILSRYAQRFGERAGSVSKSAEIAADMAASDLTKAELAEQVAKMSPKAAAAVARSRSVTTESFETRDQYRPFSQDIEGLILPEQKIVDELGFPGVKPASLVASLSFQPDFQRYQLETGMEFQKGEASGVSQAMANTLRYFPGLFTWKDQLGEQFTRSPMSSFSPEFEFAGGYPEALKGVSGIDPSKQWGGDVAVINLGKLVSMKRTDVLFELVRDYLSQEATLRSETRERILSEIGPAAELVKSLDPVPETQGKLVDIKTLLADITAVQEARDMRQPETPELKRKIATAVSALNKLEIAIPVDMLPQFRLSLDGKAVTAYPGIVAPELTVRSRVRVLPGGAIVDLDPVYMQAFGFPKVLPWQVIDGKIIPVELPDLGVESPARLMPNKAEGTAVENMQKALIAEAKRKPQVGKASPVRTTVNQSLVDDAIKNFLIEQFDILQAQRTTLESNPQFGSLVYNKLRQISPELGSPVVARAKDIVGGVSRRYAFPVVTRTPIAPDIATGRIDDVTPEVRPSAERPIYSPIDKRRAVRDLILVTDALARLAFRFSVSLAYGSKTKGEGDLRPLGVEMETGKYTDTYMLQRWASIANTMVYAIEEAARVIDPNAREVFERNGVSYERNRPDFAAQARASVETDMPAADEETRFSSYDDEFDYMPMDEQPEERIKLKPGEEEPKAVKNIAQEVARYLSGDASDDEIAALRKIFSGQKMGSVDDPRGSLLAKIHPDPDTAIALIFREAWNIRTKNAAPDVLEYATITYKNVLYRVSMSASTTATPGNETAVAVLKPVTDYPTRTVGGEPSFEAREIALFSGDRWSKVSEQLERIYYIEDAADLNRAINGFANDILGDPAYGDKIETFLQNRYGLDSIVQLGPRSLFIREFNEAMKKGPQAARSFIKQFQEPSELEGAARITETGRIEDRYIPEGLEAQRSRPGGSDDQFDSAFESGKMYSMAGQSPLQKIRQFTEPLRGPSSQRYYHGWRGFGAGAAADAAVLAAKGYLDPFNAALSIGMNAAGNFAPQKYAPKIGLGMAAANLGLTAATGGDLGRALMTTTGSILGGLVGGYFGAGVGAIGGSVAGGEMADFIWTDVFGNKNKLEQYNRAPGIEAPRPMTDFNFRP